MRLALPGLLLPLLSAACSPVATPAAAPASGAEAAAVEHVITEQFFGAIRKFDYMALRESVTADFELVEDTLRLSTDEFIAFLRPYEGSSLTYRFSDFNTEVRGPVAWTTYRNEAVLQMPQRRIDFLWLETAVLERENGRWRITRLQSTPVRPR